MPSPWDAALAAERVHRAEVGNDGGSWDSSARFFKALAAEKGEWAGVPAIISGEKLVIEPSYPFAGPYRQLGLAGETAEGELRLRVRNVFHSSLKGCEIVLYDTPEGTVDWGIIPSFHHFAQDIRTLGCADGWDLRVEEMALETLRGLVSHHQFRQYLLTGMFVERSKRSGVLYVFRRLRPTVAISRESEKILAALCLHPIGYYADSWAGAMCPTDDVLSHLMLMRGDEHMFWRRANQHAPFRREAGL